MIGSSDRSKRLAWMVLLLALMAGSIETLWLATPTAVAQDEAADEEAAAEEKPSPKKGKKKEEAKGAEAEGKSEEHFIIWVIKTSGSIGVIIFGLSCYFIATASKLFLELRPEVAMPPNLMEDIKQKMEKKDYKGVYQSIKEKECLFTKLTSAGLAELSAGLAESRDAMERVGEVQSTEMEKKISMLAVLGTLGPMIGLLGTLKGMIASFSQIARSDAGLKASEVAEGISEALLLTFEGVALSVPAIYFFAIFKNRVSSILANTMFSADEFVKKLAQAAKAAASSPKQSSASASASTVTTPPAPKA